MSSYQRLLITTDFSESSLAGLREAARLAAELQTSVTLLFVVEDRDLQKILLVQVGRTVAVELRCSRQPIPSFLTRKPVAVEEVGPHVQESVGQLAELKANLIPTAGAQAGVHRLRRLQPAMDAAGSRPVRPGRSADRCGLRCRSSLG